MLGEVSHHYSQRLSLVHNAGYSKHWSHAIILQEVQEPGHGAIAC